MCSIRCGRRRSALRDEQAEAGAAERAELVAAEADALTEVATVTARAEEAEAATAVAPRAWPR